MATLQTHAKSSQKQNRMAEIAAFQKPVTDGGAFKAPTKYTGNHSEYHDRSFSARQEQMTDLRDCCSRFLDRSTKLRGTMSRSVHSSLLVSCSLCLHIFALTSCVNRALLMHLADRFLAHPCNLLLRFCGSPSGLGSDLDGMGTRCGTTTDEKLDALLPKFVHFETRIRNEPNVRTLWPDTRMMATPS